MEHWTTRYNVRRFDQDNIPEHTDIINLSNIIKHIPSQDSKLDHFWFLLTPEHLELKEWLVDNVFFYAQGDQEDALVDEDMIQLITAPYVFLCVNTMINEKNQLNARRNSGIVLGALLAESLHMGYDTSVVGCTRGMNARDDRIQKCEEFTTKLAEYWDLSVMDPYRDSDRLVPHIALCIGHGLPLKEKIPYKLDGSNLESFGKYKYAPYGKIRKPIGNIVV